MKYTITPLSPSQLPPFADMTFPAYRHLLSRRHMITAGLMQGGKPLGLALGEPQCDRRTMELLSLYVVPEHRGNGQGTALLRCLEAAAAHRWWKHLHTTWNGAMAGAPAFARVLEKQGWNPPYRRMLVLHADIAGRFGQGMRIEGVKYEHEDCFPRGYVQKPWTAMTAEDRAFIAAREGQPGWYEPRSNPFRELRILDSELSRLLFKDGEIVGWLTVHRTAPDTARYTDVFLREDLRRAGAVAIAMVVHGFWQLMRAKVATLTWAIERDNAPLAALCRKRLAHLADLHWTWGAAKHLSP